MLQLTPILAAAHSKGCSAPYLIRLASLINVSVDEIELTLFASSVTVVARSASFAAIEA